LKDDAGSVNRSRAKNDILNKAQQIGSFKVRGVGLGSIRDASEVIADKMITTPDQAIMRPFWFGALAKEFKKQSGKDIDFEKIKNNDQEYISENQDALDAARKMADKKSVLLGASDNPFLSAAKSRPINGSAFSQILHIFNNYMTRFLVYEFNSFRYGMYAAIGRGDITPRQGAAIMTAVATRMVIYSALTQYLSGALRSLISGDDDEYTTLDFGRAVVSGVSGLILGRDFGNIAKTFINMNVEYINMKYLDMLRDGDYDAYEDKIAYTIVPIQPDPRRNMMMDIMMNIMGPMSPILRTMEFAGKQLVEKEKVEIDAIKRDELENYRAVIEMAGNLGYVPFYADVRMIMNTMIYKDIIKEKKNPTMPKSKLKEEYPDLYGKDSPSGRVKEMERRMDRSKKD